MRMIHFPSVTHLPVVNVGMVNENPVKHRASNKYQKLLVCDCSAQLNKGKTAYCFTQKQIDLIRNRCYRFYGILITHHIEDGIFVLNKWGRRE